LSEPDPKAAISAAINANGAGEYAQNKYLCDTLAMCIVQALDLEAEICDVKGPQFRGPIRIFRWKSHWREW
jgi:hypothetical protein